MSNNTKSSERIELLVAILMSCVVIATAWSAYQATLWSGIQVFLLRDSTAAGMKVTMYSIQQGQRTGLDALLFVEYIKALQNNDSELADFYLERVRPELKVAIQAWLETNPFENPNAPPHPFVMPEYEKTFAEESAKFAKESEMKLQEAQQANQISDNYVMLTVLFASVLFIGGIIIRFSSKKLRLMVLIPGLIIFAVAIAALAFMPIATE